MTSGKVRGPKWQVEKLVTPRSRRCSTSCTHVWQNGNFTGGISFFFYSFGLGFMSFMWFIWFDVFNFSHLAYLFSMFYLAHTYMLDMDECLHASLVYLWYIALECTHMEILG
jgi:hypothetical protein